MPLLHITCNNHALDESFTVGKSSCNLCVLHATFIFLCHMRDKRLNEAKPAGYEMRQIGMHFITYFICIYTLCHQINEKKISNIATSIKIHDNIKTNNFSFFMHVLLKKHKYKKHAMQKQFGFKCKVVLQISRTIHEQMRYSKLVTITN